MKIKMLIWMFAICGLIAIFGSCGGVDGIVSGTAPNIDTTPNETTKSTDATFEFSGCPYGFECSLDEAAFADCTPPVSYTGLPDGEHTLDVRCKYGTDETRYTWSIDTAPPNTTVDSGPDDPINSTDATFTFTSDDASATFECRMDGEGYAACVSGVSFSGLAEGEHTFLVRATDTAENVDETPASYTWTIQLVPPDVTAPNTTITDSNPKEGVPVIGGTPITFEFDCDEAPCTFECQVCSGAEVIDCTGQEFVACETGVQYTFPDGFHQFNVRATDAAGNTDATPASQEWNVIGA